MRHCGPRLIGLLALGSVDATVPATIAELSHEDLVADGPVAAAAIRKAFAGDASFGLLIVKGIPGFSAARQRAFNSTIKLANDPPPHSRRPRSTWPGMRSDRHVNDPLQGAFLHNLLEDVGPARVDPVFGQNTWPDAQFKTDLVAVNRLIWNVSLAVLTGTDRLVDEEARRVGSAPPQVPLSHVLHDSDFLYSLMKIYRSEFSRGDDLFDDLDELRTNVSSEPTVDAHPPVVTEVSNAGVAMAEPAAALSSMRTHAASSRAAAAMEPATSSRSTCTAEPAAALSSMRTHAASSRAAAAAAAETSLSAQAAVTTSEAVVEPYWLPWHIDPNTISTLTGDAFFDFSSASTVALPSYPASGLGLLAMNALGETVHLSAHIDDASLVVMMAAGAQVHTGGLLRGCMHAVKRSSAPPGASRIMYYQAWYGPSAHTFVPPPGSSYHPARTTAPLASDEISQRVRSIVDPIVNSVYGRTQRTMLHDFRRQFTRVPVGNEQDGTQARFEALDAALPLGTPPASSPAGLAAAHMITVDMITDLSCPLAYLALRRLRAALDAVGRGLSERVRVRFHALFVNPEMDVDGEDMESYMLRRRKLSLEEYNDDTYPLNAAARALNYSYAKERRVVNPRRAHQLVGAAGEAQHAAVYEKLAESYFEAGEDIGDMDVLLELAYELGVAADELTVRRRMDLAEGPLMRTYRALSPLVEAVPHLLVREGVHGSGIELGGPIEVSALVEALRRVDEARTTPPFGDAYDLQQPAGMVLPGYGGRPTLVPHVDRLGGPSVSSVNLAGWAGPDTWPYDDASDLARRDESDDTKKYSEPNFGTHLDMPALTSLTAIYKAFFDSADSAILGKWAGTAASAASVESHLEVLDVASSWNSHYPPLPNTTRVSVHGLNAEELSANKIAHRRDVVNLNEEPALPYANDTFDFVTMAASVAYLTKPRAVFSEMHRVLKPGGVAIVSFSNRVFEEKATSVWLSNMDEEVALCSVVRNYFYFGPRAGWQNVSSADASPHPSRGDPLWSVTAVKA